MGGFYSAAIILRSTKTSEQHSTIIDFHYSLQWSYDDTELYLPLEEFMKALQDEGTMPGKKKQTGHGSAQKDQLVGTDILTGSWRNLLPIGEWKYWWDRHVFCAKQPHLAIRQTNKIQAIFITFSWKPKTKNWVAAECKRNSPRNILIPLT